MPIIAPANLRRVSQPEFAELDYDVKRHAFASQNELGRLCDEEIYHNDLIARLRAAGLSAAKEVSLTVTHATFRKTYRLDVLVADAAIYELKTAAALTAAHEAQLLHYLFLSETQHGKLINFRPGKVESRFVNARLTADERRRFLVETDRWRERDSTEVIFRERLLALLADWGCRLELALYAEAMTHFGGGSEQVVRRLPLMSGAGCLGSQDFDLINPDTAFRLTALSEVGAQHEQYERQLHALLRLSPLRGLQWVNMDRQVVRFVTVERE